jgi:uncharacterized protein (TIGR01777 family)
VNEPTRSSHYDSRHVVIAGGSGFLGRGLTAMFVACGFKVIVLTRKAPATSGHLRSVIWDGATLGDWARELEGATAVINLAGHTINCPHTAENEKLIVGSRVRSVQAVTEAIRHCKLPPAVLVQGSAVGFYGDTGATPCEESAVVGKGFRAEACHAWEGALDPAKLPGTRCVTLRTGVVLGRDGGALPMLARLTRLFLGGAVGDGRQFISWIHQEDFNRVVLATIENERWSGVFNATAPNPATNTDYMRELRRALHRPWSPPAPACAVRLLAPFLGTDASLALESQRVLPTRLLASGFEFRFPHVPGALANLLSPPGS